MRRFVDLWQSIELTEVFRFGLCQAADLHRVVLGGRGEIGVLDVSPLAKLIARTVPWERLSQNLASGSVGALSVSTTHVPTGRTIVFVESAAQIPSSPIATNTSLVATEIGAAHVLASTAIPILFPPVRIDGELYFEGGLRLNTPMAPAIHLGADRLLVIAVSTPRSPRRRPGAPRAHQHDLAAGDRSVWRPVPGDLRPEHHRDARHPSQRRPRLTYE